MKISTYRWPDQSSASKTFQTKMQFKEFLIGNYYEQKVDKDKANTKPTISIDGKNKQVSVNSNGEYFIGNSLVIEKSRNYPPTTPPKVLYSDQKQVQNSLITQWEADKARGDKYAAAAEAQYKKAKAARS